MWSRLSAQVNWAGIGNGRLLALIAGSGKFDLFLTVDRRLPQQNKVSALPFAIVLLRAKSNRLPHILPFAPEVLRRLAEFQPGRTYVLAPPA